MAADVLFELRHVDLCLSAHMTPQRILQVLFQGTQVHLYVREFLFVYVIKSTCELVHMRVGAYGSMLASGDLPTSDNTRRNTSARLEVAAYVLFELGHMALCFGTDDISAARCCTSAVGSIRARVFVCIRYKV